VRYCCRVSGKRTWLIVGALVALASPAHAVPVPVGRLGVTLHAGIDPLTPMPTERGGAARTGRLRGVLPASEPRVRFDVALGGAHPRGPIVNAEGMIFAGTAQGLVGLTRDGSVAFDLHLGPIDTAPALLPSGELIVLFRDRMLRIVGPDGVVHAERSIPSSVRAAPLVLEDGSFLIAALDRTLTHYGTDLTERFVLTFEDGGVTSPTLCPSGHVAIAAGTVLHVVDVERGTILARFPLPSRAVGPTVASPTGVLYQLLADGTLVAIADESRVLFQRDLEGGRVIESTALALASDGTLRAALQVRGIVSVSGETGEVLWSFATDAPFGNVVVDEEGNALGVDRRGRLTVIDPGGTMRFRLELGVPGAAFAIAEGLLVVASDRPSILAFELP
jgi:outer membrane protein assembly factor BamB